MSKKNKKVVAVSPPSIEHKNMILSIGFLPDTKVPIFDINRKAAMKEKRSFWYSVALRIDYLQNFEAGYLIDDPIDNLQLHPKQKEYLDIFSRYKFATLNVVIKGWDKIKNTAISVGRPFPFADPRELFIEICLEWANDPIEDMVSTEIHTAPTLTEVREGAKHLNAFYTRRLDGEELKELLDFHKNGGWSYFWIYGVWENCYKKELKDVWKKFVTAHKEITRFAKETKPKDGTALVMVRHHAGRSVYSDTGKPAILL